MDFKQISIFDIFDAKKEKYQITKPIALIELFAGVGSQALSLDVLGVPYKHHFVCEFDKYAIKSYNAIHHTEFDTIDIRDVHGADLKIDDKDHFCYMLTYSFPCFVGNTLVLTKEGYQEIADVIVGDQVMTHTGEFMPVTNQMMTGVKETYKIKTMGADSIECTENHKFYVRKMVRHCPTKDGKRVRVREFTEPKWVEAKNLDKTHYVGTVVNTNSIMPEWDGITIKWNGRNREEHKNIISELMYSASFWWVIGRYLGDGWCRTQGGIIICCNVDETFEITERLELLGLSYSVSRERTVNKIHIANKELGEFVKLFGYKADGKKIPGFVFDMPKCYVKALVRGYESADGCRKGKAHTVSSVSRELIYGMAQLVAKAFETPYSIWKVERANTCVIEGRTVNQKPSYELCWKKEKCKQDKAFYENGYVWFPVRSVIKTGRSEEVYDISVENNHSFLANGIIVHNCTDLSVAGKQLGMSKESGTRSGLLWEVERILTELQVARMDKPDVLLMENVPMVHSSKNEKDWNEWLHFLESIGYTNFWNDCNAADFGVPQSRNRTFMVSILGNYDYKFPEPIELQSRMKDYLEPVVDEKYYIKSDRAKKLLDGLKENGKLPPQ